MIDLSRFAQGLPDPQETEPEFMGSCAGCGMPLYAGDEVIRAYAYGDLYCTAECFAKVSGREVVL